MTKTSRPKSNSAMFAALTRYAESLSQERGDLLQVLKRTERDDGSQMRIVSTVHGKALVDAYLKVTDVAPKIDDLALLNDAGLMANELVGNLLTALRRHEGTELDTEYYGTAVSGFIVGVMMELDRELLSANDKPVHFRALHAVFLNMGVQYVKASIAAVKRRIDEQESGKPESDPAASPLDINVGIGSVVMSCGMNDPMASASDEEHSRIADAARDAAAGRAKGQA